MSAVELVDEARDAARWLINKEYQGYGDLNRAIACVADKCGLRFGTLWKLWYKDQRDILASVFFAIITTYDRERRSEARPTNHGRNTTAGQSRASAALLRWAAAFDSAADAIDGGRPGSVDRGGEA